MKVEGGAIRVSFDYAGGGLASGGKPLTHFEIAGDDRKFVPAEAAIDGATVLVSSPAVAHPVAVRFACGNAPEPNLANEEGLPASPFRTDDWPLALVGSSADGMEEGLSARSAERVLAERGLACLGLAVCERKRAPPGLSRRRPRRGLRPTPTAKQPARAFGSTRAALQRRRKI